MQELIGILICWTLALFTFSMLGATVFHLLKIDRQESNQLFQYLIQVVAGIAVFTTTVGFLSLVMPVTATITGAVILLCIVGAFHAQIRERALIGVRAVGSLALYAKLILLMLGLVVLWVSGFPSLNYDTGLYHNQFIMWMNNYAAVPGLANLHERLGFNSHWHLLAASFNGYPYMSTRFNDLGSLLLLVFLAAAVESVQAIISGQNKEGMLDGLLALSLVPLYLLVRFLTSDTPDLPNAIIGFAILAVAFYTGFSKQQKLLVTALVGGLLITIKVSSFVLLAAAIPSLFRVHWKKVLLPVFVGLLVLAPWLARNYTFTGYLVFPASFTAVGSPDHQLPEETIEYMNALLESHGKFGKYDVTLVGRPVSEWWRIWLGHQTTAIKLILAFCFILLIVLGSFDSWRMVKSKFGYRESVDFWVHLIFLASMIIVFDLAPEIRYSYGILLFYFVYLLLRVGLVKFRLGIILASVIGILMFARIVKVVSGEPPAPRLSKTYNEIDGSAMPIYYPEEFDQCWEHQLPCANRYIEGLEMRSDKLQDGFRISK